jgi:thimet oligopeptidase
MIRPLFLILSSLVLTPFARAESTPLIRYDYAPGEITNLCDQSIIRMNSEIEKIKSRPFFELWLPSRSLLAFENSAKVLSDETNPLTFMSSVSKSAELRKEASACEEKLGQLFPQVLSDKKLYRALKRAFTFGSEEGRLASETLRDFEKSGMDLDDAKLALLTETKQKLATLEAKFSLNLNNDRSEVLFSKADLEGLPAVFLARLVKSPDGKFRVTTKSTDYIQVMENAKKASTRKAMALAYLNRGSPENTKLLEEAITLRGKIASLLGFASWADVQIDGRMAKSSKNVLDFLTGLKAKLIARKEQDLAKLLEFKKTIEPNAKAVNAEDVAYLSYQLKKKKFAFDDNRVAEYFPAEKTMEGLFEIYSVLFGVKFFEVKNAPVWADGVTLYEIKDTATGNLRAYFYKDTTPREGKYGHAAAFTLISGQKVGTDYTKPISAIVANFTPPANGRPSLLLHDEVETLFHEFGHIMHQTLTRAPYASLSGSRVAQDFVEAPSQMLENWVWNAEILKKISSHYKTDEKIPDELIAKLVAAKDFNQGYGYIRQLLFAFFDLKIHSEQGPIDVTKTYNEMYKELFGYDVIEDSHFPAGFGHLMGGYDAGYYGYLWSEVYAQDLFSRFEKEGLLNPKTGADYRRAILEPGNMREPGDLLREFLGREPNSDAFYRKLGLEGEAR